MCSLPTFTEITYRLLSKWLGEDFKSEGTLSWNKCIIMIWFQKCKHDLNESTVCWVQIPMLLKLEQMCGGLSWKWGKVQLSREACPGNHVDRSFSFSAASEILRLFILSYISPLSNLLSENKSEKFICTEVNVTDNSCYISSPWNSYILAKRMCPALQNFRHENVNGGKMLLVVGIFWYPVKRTKKGIVWLLSL